MQGVISPVMVSNLITMSICARHDKRQSVGGPYSVPDEVTRRLRAQLILEEALETIKALGFVVSINGEPRPVPADLDIHEIIDGCADLNYVLVGTLVACGVPDEPHFQEVCSANEDKFPDGVAVFDADGKFQEPEGWEPPKHDLVQESTSGINLRELASYYLKGFMKARGK